MNSMAWFLTLFLVIAYMLQTCHCTNSSYGCKEAERQALLTFKQSFSDPGGKLSSWDGMHCCQWDGVGCDLNTGYVIKVDLQNTDDFYLEASKLDSSLLELRYLNYLDLSGNNFSGSGVPEFLGEMNGLKYLNLSFASFTIGLFPPQLGNLTNLQVLDLSDTNLNGVRNLFPILNKLPFLSVLSLSRCRLNDTHLSPKTHSNLKFFFSVRELHLSRNNFFSFPLLLKNMSSSLRVLDLSYNSFNSSIPMWLPDLKDLEYLDLSHNAFNKVEGGLGRILWGLCHLKTFDFSSNFQQEELNRNVSLGCNTYELEVLKGGFNGLTGVLPDELCHFKKLKILSLYTNALHGSIHALIGNLSGLIEINLRFNQLNGTIPASLGNLLSLRKLDLGNNSLHGAIPTTIGNLTTLSYINLNSNQLNGAIPACLGNLLSLRMLDLGNNHFYGAIPTTIGNLSALIELRLSNNQLRGVVPDSIRQLFNLEILDVSSNYLSGQLSETLFSNVPKLYWLDLSSNQLTITFTPDWIPSFQLKQLGMASCKIGTVFPLWVGTQKNLTGLDLSNASITGPWPKWFQSSLLDYLDLSHNEISGHIPHNIADLFPALQSLYLSSNRLNGTIPRSFCKMGKLYFLDISRNMLSGEIPNCWGEDTPNLYSLKLSFNKLTGFIPSSVGNLFTLQWLQLNNNRLKGEIPSLLSSLPVLFLLNLADNGLSGSIPTWMGEMGNLQIIVLRKNRFDGYIPKQLCQMKLLQILDVAYNNLTGSIPNCVGSLTAMTTIKSENYAGRYNENLAVTIKRLTLEYTNSLRLVMNIDMSSNNLVGIIPPELTLLSGLLGLNLSNNHLTGTIPKNIGNLTALESLDLSNNHLSGKIPTSLSLLHGVSSLNLSHNNLSGRIPTGNQLQTLIDPSIYDDNPNLCGDPLPKRCPGDEPVHVPVITDEEEDKSDKIWLYLAITIGYAFGLWAFFGILMFKKKWRYAYFRYVDYAKDWIYVFIVVNARRLKRKMTGGDE